MAKKSELIYNDARKIGKGRDWDLTAFVLNGGICCYGIVTSCLNGGFDDDPCV